jgi:hypothetical protein
MSKVNDGGPAHPFVRWRSPDGMMSIDSAEGMSLRDWFAGQALAGLIAQSGGTATGSDKAVGASWAYRMADAMLKVREGGTP